MLFPTNLKSSRNAKHIDDTNRTTGAPPTSSTSSSCEPSVSKTRRRFSYAPQITFRILLLTSSSLSRGKFSWLSTGEIGFQLRVSISSEKCTLLRHVLVSRLRPFVLGLTEELITLDRLNIFEFCGHREEEDEIWRHANPFEFRQKFRLARKQQPILTSVPTVASRLRFWRC
jgi:hypothetical protein